MEITQLIEGLQKVQGFQNGAWNKVVETARKYAQMKAFGTITDAGTGHTHVVSNSQIEYYERTMLEDLVREVMQAYQEDAAVGTELMKLIVQK